MKLGSSPISLQLPSSSTPSDPVPSSTSPPLAVDVVEELSDDDAFTVDQLSSAWSGPSQSLDGRESLPKKRRYSTRLADK